MRAITEMQIEFGDFSDRDILSVDCILFPIAVTFAGLVCDRYSFEKFAISGTGVTCKKRCNTLESNLTQRCS